MEQIMSKVFNAISKAMMKQRRKMLSRNIFDRYNGTVQLGPYKNMKLGSRSNISQGPLALKILGLYEKQVTEKIHQIGKFQTLINFGAADGYMALGPLFSGACNRSICFEMTEKGRESIKINAKLNQINQKVEVLGKVDDTIIKQLNELKINSKNSVVLCDIEGAEFNIFSTDLFEFLKKSTIIIELHDRLIQDGQDLRKSLISKIPKGLNYEIIADYKSINYFGLKDLEELSDNDRALVMSEGRKFFGEWLVVSP